MANYSMKMLMETVFLEIMLVTFEMTFPGRKFAPFLMVNITSSKFSESNQNYREESRFLYVKFRHNCICRSACTHGELIDENEM